MLVDEKGSQVKTLDHKTALHPAV